FGGGPVAAAGPPPDPARPGGRRVAVLPGLLQGGVVVRDLPRLAAPAGATRRPARNHGQALRESLPRFHGLLVARTSSSLRTLRTPGWRRSMFSAMRRSSALATRPSRPTLVPSIPIFIPPAPV